MTGTKGTTGNDPECVECTRAEESLEHVNQNEVNSMPSFQEEVLLTMGVSRMIMVWAGLFSLSRIFSCGNLKSG